jgi:hypothetical protein
MFFEYKVEVAESRRIIQIWRSFHVFAVYSLNFFDQVDHNKYSLYSLLVCDQDFHPRICFLIGAPLKAQGSY